MTQTIIRSLATTVHRLDLPCEQTGFTTPPFDVHIKFLPSPLGLGGESEPGWTLLANAAPGKPDALAVWLRSHPFISDVRAAPGLAPRLLRAKAAVLPEPWARVASFVRVHHLDLAPEGSASWFIEGSRERILALVQLLEGMPTVPLALHGIRCRPVQQSLIDAPLSRRQFEALASAVSLGYYEIPHRLDLRALAARTGISLGSVSELLRRAEASVLTHYVDSILMRWPHQPGEEPGELAAPMDNLLHH